MPRQNRDKGGARQEVRIIGGQWRRRKIAFAGIPGLRPTPDRVRETLFNWLQPELPGAHVLDLFAGSGALGFEALSRGASKAVLVESASQACKHLQEFKNLLNADAAEIVQADVLSYLSRPPKSPYQIVFVDPPYQENLYMESFQALIEHSWIGKDSLIYVEADAETLPEWPEGWGLHRQLAAGNLIATLLRSL